MSSLPSPVNLPTTKLRLEVCWVCGARFTEFGGAPNVFKEEHHIIPRAFGGTDGPEVSLCDRHHTALHAIAIQLEKKKPYHQFLAGNQDSDRRLLLLAVAVVNAKLATLSDPNKPMPIHFVAKGATKKKLKELKKVYHLAMGDILEIAVDSLYQRHFQIKAMQRKDRNVGNAPQTGSHQQHKTLYRV